MNRVIATVISAVVAILPIADAAGEVLPSLSPRSRVEGVQPVAGDAPLGASPQNRSASRSTVLPADSGVDKPFNTRSIPATSRLGLGRQPGTALGPDFVGKFLGDEFLPEGAAVDRDQLTIFGILPCAAAEQRYALTWIGEIEEVGPSSSAAAAENGPGSPVYPKAFRDRYPRRVTLTLRVADPPSGPMAGPDEPAGAAEGLCEGYMRFDLLPIRQAWAIESGKDDSAIRLHFDALIGLVAIYRFPVGPDGRYTGRKYRPPTPKLSPRRRPKPPKGIPDDPSASIEGLPRALRDTLIGIEGTGRIATLAPSARAPLGGSATVEGAVIDGDLIQLHPRGYDCGCGSHHFGLYWDGAVPAKGTAAIIHLDLRHHLGGEYCAKTCRDAVRFDLRPIAAAWKKAGRGETGVVDLVIPAHDAPRARYVVRYPF